MTHVVERPPAPVSSARDTTSNVIDVRNLSYNYGDVEALCDVNFAVPRGALYALLGPNGSGKTTLLQILMGLRRPRSGSATVVGVGSTKLSIKDRAAIGYIAEGQALPGWMRLEQLEAYLAPLYDTWDTALAADLRRRFELDPKRKIKHLSRGEYMKAALLCALAPRPRLLIMDEPFTGMDALVKDELVRGLLESAGTEGWTVLLCSHDIGELELLADWVAFLDRGRMRLAEPMDAVRERFRYVEITATDNLAHIAPPPTWLALEQAGGRIAFVVEYTGTDLARDVVAPVVQQTVTVDSRAASLREVFVALARRAPSSRPANS